MAYSNMSQLRMLQDDLQGAVHWGMQAIDLAEALGDGEILVHALNNVGSAQLEHGDQEGRTRLEASLHLALVHDFEEHAARAYTNLSSGAVKHREYALATKYFDEGIQYCTEHDLDIWRLYMTGWRAQVRLDLGDFEGASVVAGEVLASYHISPVIRIPALVVLAWVRLRRGDPGHKRRSTRRETWRSRRVSRNASFLLPQRAPRRPGCAAIWSAASPRR